MKGYVKKSNKRSFKESVKKFLPYIAIYITITISLAIYININVNVNIDFEATYLFNLLGTILVLGLLLLVCLLFGPNLFEQFKTMGKN